MIDLTLIFPPTHDFAMPYLALPYLKGYLQDSGSHDVIVVDINLLFYEKIIGIEQIMQYKKDVYGAVKSDNLNNAVDAILKYEDFTFNANNRFGDEIRLSKRKLGTNFDQLSINCILNAQAIVPNLYKYLYDIIKDNIQCSRCYGINVTVEDQVFLAFVSAKIIKTLFPASLVILGGNIISRCTFMLNNTDIPFVDFFIAGEAESVLRKILSDKKAFNIQKESKSKIIKSNELFSYNSVPFADFSDVTPNTYSCPFPVIPIQASRRCRWAKCDFCAIHKSWFPVSRERTLVNVVDEIKAQISYGCRYIRFVDEHLPATYAGPLSNLITSESLDIAFEAYCRIEEEFISREFCDKLYAAGCRQIFWGVESVGKATLRKINKGIFYSKAAIGKVLNTTSQTGILNYVFLLIGIPGTPLSEEIETINFVIENHSIQSVGLGTFVVDSLSPIHLDNEIASRYGIKLADPLPRISTEIPYTCDAEAVSADHRANEYLAKIFAYRSDLALSSLFDEESRLVLCDKFGNNFAQEYMTTKRDTTIIQERAIEKTMIQRVIRSL